MSEAYAGNRTIVEPGARSPEYKILSDNVVCQSYSDGSVEHWKISLSDEDIEKNREKWREEYTRENGKFAKYDAGNKHLLWWNGVGKRRSIMDDTHIQAMWCYHEGGEEPSAESYASMIFAKTMGEPARVSRSRSAAGPSAQRAEATSSEEMGNAAPSLFARLIAKVKDFFAGLFA
ncbi:MAG: hypothetical protein IK083_10050 [Abditibacteriota bacterium]|nr:hypothetical protein [Abditibacteriota bacterium]